MLLLIYLCLPETIAKRERNPQTEEQKNNSIVTPFRRFSGVAG